MTVIASLDLASPADTGALARQLAPLLHAGDILALDGPLGAGKTHFARALIQARGIAEDVPSPTFTLVQVYEPASGAPLWHFDLYRLDAPAGAYELGIEDAFEDAVSLIEWPARLGPLLPARALILAFTPGTAPSQRRLDVIGDESWRQRLQPLMAAARLASPDQKDADGGPDHKA